MGLQVIGAERDWRFSGFALLTLVWSVDRGGSRSGIHCLQGLGFSVFCVQGLGGQRFWRSGLMWGCLRNDNAERLRTWDEGFVAGSMG